MTYPSLEKRRQADEDQKSCYRKAADLWLECKSYDEFRVRMDLECFGPSAAHARRCFKTYFWAVDQFCTSSRIFTEDVIDKMNMWYVLRCALATGCAIVLLLLITGVNLLVPIVMFLGVACWIAMQCWRRKQFCQAAKWIEEAEMRRLI